MNGKLVLYGLQFSRARGEINPHKFLHPNLFAFSSTQHASQNTRNSVSQPHREIPLGFNVLLTLRI